MLSSRSVVWSVDCGRWAAIKFCEFRYAKTKKGPVGTLVLAEGVGFEPTVRKNPYTGFRIRRIRPLCHPSGVLSQRRAANYSGARPLDRFRPVAPAMYGCSAGGIETLPSAF